MTDRVREWYGPRRVGLVFAAIATVAGLAEAHACSVCGCGDPLQVASDPAAVAGKLRLQADTEHLGMTAGSDRRTGYVDHLSQWSFRVNAAYRPTSGLSFVATVPLLYKRIHTVGGGTDTPTSQETGLGDVELAARYVLWRSINFSYRRVHEIAASLGTALPTGAHDAKTIEAGQVVPVDPHGQVGTGAWGPFAGAHYRFEQGDWVAYADVSYRLRTTATYFDHSTYKFGDALLYGVHGQHRPLPPLVGDLGVDGRFARVDRAAAPGDSAAGTVPNTGGTVLSLAPGVYFNAVGGLWVFGRAQIPFVQALRGQQDVGTVLSAGLQYELL